MRKVLLQLLFISAISFVFVSCEKGEEPFPGNPILSPGKSAWTMHGMHHLDAHELGPDDWVACVDGYRRKLTTELQY